MKAQERQLLELFRQLDEAGQHSLLAFAEFLCQRQAPQPQALMEPVAVAAAEGESVVGALKRLSQTYPMLDKAVLLNATSPLMAQHIMQGRERLDVIAELEQVFEQHYQQYRQQKGPSS